MLAAYFILLLLTIVNTVFIYINKQNLQKNSRLQSNLLRCINEAIKHQRKLLEILDLIKYTDEQKSQIQKHLLEKFENVSQTQG